MQTSAKLLDSARLATVRRGLSRKTRNAYLNHVRRFVEFYENRDLCQLKTEEITDFFEHLEGKVQFSPATRNQALSALLFFYREVLDCEGWQISAIKRVRTADKIPVIFTEEEAQAVLSHLDGAVYLSAALIYGSGLRLSEAVGLRVGDLDFTRHEITVRDARTGAKQRTTILPEAIIGGLKRHLVKVLYQFEDDCLLGFGKVFVPKQIARKFPEAEGEWRWQFVFPACKLAQTFDTLQRSHLAESTVQKAIGEAVRKAKITKTANSQTFRHSFAMRLFENSCDVHLIQNLLGHKNLKSTLGYTNLSPVRGNFIASPLDK